MKRVLSIILIFTICLSLCACGKSQAAKDCEELIAAIGEVSVDSKDAIEAAERAYSALTEKEKDSIADSAAIMNDAIEAYYNEACKLIFSTLNNANEIVAHFGEDLYTLGIATVNDFSFSSKKLDHLKHLLEGITIYLTEDELKQGIEATVEGHDLLDGMPADGALFVANLYHVLDELCMKGVSNAYKLTDRVTAVRNLLYEASVMMAGVESVDSCAQTYVILEKYYDAIEEYFEICLDIDDASQISNFGIMRDSYLGYSGTYISDLEALLAN